MRFEGALGRSPWKSVPARKGLELGLGPQQGLQLPWPGTCAGMQGCREPQMRGPWAQQA